MSNSIDLISQTMRDVSAVLIGNFKRALKVPEDQCPTPCALVLGAIQGAIDVARTSECEPREILAISLATVCHTEEQAHLAVTEAFRRRTEVESRTGYSHGPDLGRERGQS